MRIGIITITIGSNYGNRLQNYALQEIIKKLGYEVVTLKNQPYVKKNIKGKMTDFSKRTIKSMMFFSKYRNLLIREKTFSKFNRVFIDWSPIYISNHSIPEDIEEHFDLYVCGSDQIWNPMFKENNIVNFLAFTTYNKRATYAPSFGTDFIPKERMKEFSEYLQGFDSLSVREIAGQEIIRELTGKEATLVLDPAMLLTKEDWKVVSKTALIKHKSKYIFAYFLGHVKKSYESGIKKIADKHDLDIIWLGGDDKKTNPKIGPAEFLSLIMNAELVCTDSFHGMIFAMNFSVPFIVYDRQDQHISMISRVETVVDLFSIGDRRYCQKLIENPFDLDYSLIQTKLNTLRKNSIDYLRNDLTKSKPL